jgi:radical SAM superfamily enzyme YgiQ (UPF0313 family)
LEGKSYRLKSPKRVLAEAQFVTKCTDSRKVMFCDNNFNAPRQHAEAICKTWIAEDADIQWGTGDLRPVGITSKFCKLLEESGCFYANLAIESASGKMLKSMKRGYTVRQVREALEVMSHSQIPFSTSLLLGAPGETAETIEETLAVLGKYKIPNGVWVTVGVYMWTDFQDIVTEARAHGILKNDKDLFNGAVYLSPSLSGPYLQELLNVIRSKPGYLVQFNKPYQAWSLQST